MCVNNNKCIRVHSRRNSERMDRTWYSFLTMKNLIYYEKAFLISGLLSKKDASRLSDNISKHIKTSDIHDIVFGRNYYFPVTKSCLRENNQIHFSAMKKNSFIYGWCLFLNLGLHEKNTLQYYLHFILVNYNLLYDHF